MKIVTIVGARPQFIKAAAVSREIRENYSNSLEEVLVHTGQHFDENMSKVFFDELEIPNPAYNLGVSGGQHGAMTGKMLEAIETVLLKERPDCLLVYGDTNSTLAGALAAAKLQIPIAHVEAGLRSFNMNMPEEVNRILTDRISSHLFCPTETAVGHLQAEGISNNVHNVGDVMYDVALFYGNKAVQNSTILQHLDLVSGNFALVTCHRAENTDYPVRLKEILIALEQLAKTLPIVFPLHPRTKKLINEQNLSHYLKNIKVIDPLPFLDMIALERNAKFILTDSGGVQKEAYFYKVPCITMRDETEWVETIKCGANKLVGADSASIIDRADELISRTVTLDFSSLPYGNGIASQKIISILSNKI